MSGDDFTVLTVCTGNVNRSALAATLLDTWSRWYLPESLAGHVRVVSAGLRAPVGSAMGPRARVIAEALGADGAGHRAQQISERSIRSADLVLVSSTSQRDDVLGLVPGALQSTFTIPEIGRLAEPLGRLPAPESVADLRERVATIARSRMAAGDADDDIVDPQGKDDEAYRDMARQEVPPLAILAGALLGMPRSEVDAYRAAAEAAEFRFTPAEEPEPHARTRPPGRHEA
jgi:protein-tyrosine phosphatase